MNTRITTTILAVLLAGCGGTTFTPLKVGDAAPSFKLEQVGNTTSSFESESMRGSVVLLNFWSSTCANCIEEIEELKAIQAEGYVQVIGIAIDDDAQSVSKMMDSKQINYPVLNGDETTFLQFDGFSTPYSLLLAPDLTVRKKINGRLDREELNALIESI